MDRLDAILGDVRQWLDAGRPAAAVLGDICRRLKQAFGPYDWVGFYVLDADGRTLNLGPFEGEPTEHVKIPVGRGICGQAAAAGKTFVVGDVSAESNYLSCSPRVKSEIVVPIFRAGRVVAELDIDSHTPHAFTPADQEFLNKLCGMLGNLF